MDKAEFRDLMEERLGVRLPIRMKAMFGGYGIYSGELFFALIAEAKLYFKVSDLNRGDFEAAGMEPFYPWDSPTPMNYWEVPPQVIDDVDELHLWAEKALAVAEAAKRPRKRKGLSSAITGTRSTLDA